SVRCVLKKETAENLKTYLEIYIYIYTYTIFLWEISFEQRLFGVTGNCAACSKLIPAFEMVMRAKDNVYHLDCFACQLCNQRFCVGDKFFLKNNMILCQTDYEEGLMKEGYAPQVR
uniref:LIM domain only protein 3 n=1 Tax=Equus caballus TaxID=9796 RepID=A0A5F5PXW2_HORSE